MPPNPRIVKFTIECTDLPPAADWGGHREIRLGIQRGKEVEQERKLPADMISFEAELRVSGDEGTGKPNFLGPFAQGSADDRFVYLCWGSRHGGMWIGFRRAKLKLSAIDWSDIASNELRATVRCTDAKGGPICATVPAAFVTWQ